MSMRMAKTTDYVDHGDGTVTDTRTGLMWKQCLEGQSGVDCEGTAGLFDWDNAMKIPQTVNQHGGFAGHRDWRIPSRYELESLVMHERTNHAICTEAFPNAPASGVWSCSRNAYGTGFAWVVLFHYGLSSYSYGDGCRTDFGVRLVRGGQKL